MSISKYSKEASETKSIRIVLVGEKSCYVYYYYYYFYPAQNSAQTSCNNNVYMTFLKSVIKYNNSRVRFYGIIIKKDCSLIWVCYAFVYIQQPRVSVKKVPVVGVVW